MKPIFNLKGVNGQLELYNDKVIIKRKGALAKATYGFFKGEKTLYLKQIAGIQIKKGGMLTNGYIQFTVPGGIENTNGILDATQDENTVMFTRKNNELVNKIKAKIEELQQQSFNTAQVINRSSPADEIKKYKELLDQGVLTEDEFNKAKAELLHQIAGGPTVSGGW